MSDTPATGSAKSVADRAALRTMSERRWRVWLNVAIFLLVTSAMVLLSMTHRDHQSVQSCRERLAFTCAELEKLLAAGELAPRGLPLPDQPEIRADAPPAERERHEDEMLSRREHYFYNSGYGRSESGGGPVGVCCCTARHHLYLRQDGRHAIVFDGQRYELHWMTEPEFRGRLAALGLNVPEEP